MTLFRSSTEFITEFPERLSPTEYLVLLGFSAVYRVSKQSKGCLFFVLLGFSLVSCGGEGGVEWGGEGGSERRGSGSSTAHLVARHATRWSLVLVLLFFSLTFFSSTDSSSSFLPGFSTEFCHRESPPNSALRYPASTEFYRVFLWSITGFTELFSSTDSSSFLPSFFLPSFAIETCLLALRRDIRPLPSFTEFFFGLSLPFSFRLL